MSKNKQRIEVASIPTRNYKEVIEIRVPTRFYWDKDGVFDGIEFGEFKTKLLPWEEDMVNRCLNEIMSLMGDTEAKATDSPALQEERKRIGGFLEESKETFYAVYRDVAGEQTYTIRRHALDKIINTLKAGKGFAKLDSGGYSE
jgi:hypothetical protein